MSARARQSAFPAWVPWAVLGLHAIPLLLLSQFKVFDPDEFQHIHMAWNMKQGQLIFRDFMDNHGALFPLINDFLWRLLDLPDDGRTLLAFRAISLVWLAGVGMLTWAIAARSLGRSHAVVALAVLSTSLIFMEKGIEVRPDGPQVICWLACVLFLLRAVESERRSDAFLSGLWLGLSLVANLKMLTGVVAVGAYGALELWFSRQRPGWVLAMGLSLAAGIVAGLLPTVLYFAARGALWEFYYYSLPFNVLILGQVQGNQFSADFPRFVATNFFLLFTAAPGIAMLFARSGLPEAPDRTRLCLLTLTVITSGFSVMGYYNQYYLVFVPLLAVVGSHFLVEGLAGSSTRPRFVTALLVLQIFVVASCTFVLVFDPLRPMQFARLDFVLRNSPADEPVGYTCMDHAGYVFRPDVQYHWTNSNNLRPLFDEVEGYSVFGERFVERLEQTSPTFFIALDSDGERQLAPTEEAMAALVEAGYSLRSYPDATREYIEANYEELAGLAMRARTSKLTPALRAEAKNTLRQVAKAHADWEALLMRFGLFRYWNFVADLYRR